MDRTTITIKAYNQNSEKFAKKFMEFPPYCERVHEFIEYLNPGMNVLDLGCGPGNVLKLLSLSGKQFFFTGVDLSEEMLKIARKNVSGASFICQDIRDVCFNENTFDAVILSFCIVHLVNAETVRLLTKVSKYLKHEGKLYLSFMEGKNDGFETTSFSSDKLFFCYHESNAIKDVLMNNGIDPFKIIKQDYKEEDGTITTDVFIYAEKH